MATSITAIATGHRSGRPVAEPAGVRIGSRMWGALSWLIAAWFRGWTAYVRRIRSRSLGEQ